MTIGVAFRPAGIRPAAQAANPLELNFGLIGPQYDGRVKPRGGARDDHVAIPGKGKHLLEFLSTITAYGQIHEIAFRPWQSDNIPRRYCSGDAMLSDGQLRRVHYSIIEDGGFAGFDQGVEWCVTGLDRNWAFNPVLHGRPALIASFSNLRLSVDLPIQRHSAGLLFCS